jgi:photosystem II stability/assembly factor-like uncharacterized protein
MSCFVRRVAWSLGLCGLALVTAVQPVTGQQIDDRWLAPIDFREIGPTRQGGRFVDIAVPTDDPNTLYMATASGHLWKSENNGTTFTTLFTDQPVFSIGAIALAPSNSDVLYLGSGEGNNSRSSYWGNGVYRSDDAGETWQHLGLDESHHIGRIVVHPENPDMVYVAALGHLYSENPERGLYRSRDGGRTWAQVLAPQVEGRTIGVVDVAMNPENPQQLFAATYDKVRLPFTFDLGGPGSRVYRSDDGGDTWQMLTNGLPQGMIGRIGVDIHRADPSIVYLTIENANKADLSDEARRRELLEHRSSAGIIDGEVYRSDDGGDSWRRVSSDDPKVGGEPGYYYGQVRVDPNDPDVAYVLSISTYGTRDGGETWTRNVFGFGGDDHALWIDPADSDHMILGHDHGMGITWDGGKTWFHPDYMSLAQFYAIGYDMSYPYRVVGGLQDNGSVLGPSTNPAGGPIRFEMWQRVGGGDGMYNEIEPCENRYLYNESQFGPLVRTDLRTGERANIRHSDPELRWNWNSPILISPHDCDVIFHAANRLLRSDNRGERWTPVSPDLTRADSATLTTGKGGDGNIQYATITSIDQSPIDADVLWVGTDDGNVQLSRDGGENWELLNDHIPDHPGYWVSRIVASHHDPAVAYVTFTGYRRDDFRPFVFRTDDFGQSWHAIVNGLPDGPVNVIREHVRNPELLFVGTEFGVFVSIDLGANWTPLRNDLPTTPVHDLKLHPREDDLIVGTHGRGIYIADIRPLVEFSPEVMERSAFLFEPESKVRWTRFDGTNYAFNNFEGESEPEGIPLYVHVSDDVAEAGSLTVYQGSVPMAWFDVPAEPGLHEIVWGMDRRTERSAEQIEQARARMARFGREVSEDELRYTSESAPMARYRVVLEIDGITQEREVEILRDEWVPVR